MELRSKLIMIIVIMLNRMGHFTLQIKRNFAQSCPKQKTNSSKNHDNGNLTSGLDTLIGKAWLWRCNDHTLLLVLLFLAKWDSLLYFHVFSCISSLQCNFTVSGNHTNHTSWPPNGRQSTSLFCNGSVNDTRIEASERAIIWLSPFILSWRLQTKLVDSVSLPKQRLACGRRCVLDHFPEATKSRNHSLLQFVIEF